MTEIRVQTERKTQILNVTERLSVLLEDLDDGIALFFLPHTTAALIISEDDDELRNDFEKVSRTWLEHLRPFEHIRGNNPNAESHILSAFAGTSIAVGVSQGKLELGPYQNILLLEMDGPKKRSIRCKFINQR
jgi:secondary thiamine-phosphate synthase enzyme